MSKRRKNNREGFFGRLKKDRGNCKKYLEVDIAEAAASIYTRRRILGWDKPRCYCNGVCIFYINLDCEVHCQEAIAAARTGWARQRAQIW